MLNSEMMHCTTWYSRAAISLRSIPPIQASAGLTSGSGSIRHHPRLRRTRRAPTALPHPDKAPSATHSSGVLMSVHPSARRRRNSRGAVHAANTVANTATKTVLPAWRPQRLLSRGALLAGTSLLALVLAMPVAHARPIRSAGGMSAPNVASDAATAAAQQAAAAASQSSAALTQAIQAMQAVQAAARSA